MTFDLRPLSSISGKINENNQQVKYMGNWQHHVLLAYITCSGHINMRDYVAYVKNVSGFHSRCTLFIMFLRALVSLAQYQP